MINNWKERFISIFNDELLADVRPIPKEITADDRLVESINELLEWIGNNGRIPQSNTEDFTEKKMERRLKGILDNEDKRNFLESLDIENLLDLI